MAKYVESVARIYLAGDIHGELEIGMVEKSNILEIKSYILCGDIFMIYAEKASLYLEEDFQ